MTHVETRMLRIWEIKDLWFVQMDEERINVRKRFLGIPFWVLHRQ